MATVAKQQCQQQCRKSFVSKFSPFDKVECCFNKVERCFDIVAKNDNSVKATGNNVSLTLFLVWTGLSYTVVIIPDQFSYFIVLVVCTTIAVTVCAYFASHNNSDIACCI